MKTGNDDKKTPGSFEDRWLLEVCRLLNEEKARYIVVGGVACNLHGLIRATKDIDLLIPKDVENAQSVLDALKGLTFGIAGELEAEKVVKKPFTIIGDMPRVDLLTVAHQVSFQEAFDRALRKTIDGVPIVYADYETLVRSKQTGRLQDQADLEKLKQIYRNNRPKK